MVKRLNRRKRINLRTESLERRYVLDSTVVFNEVMYNPEGIDSSQEWIELHNQMSVDVDISGWSIEGGAEFTFPSGTVLEGGDYLVVSTDPTNMEGIDNLFGPMSGRLSNGGERLELRNHIDRLMNVLEFEDSNDWPWGPDGSGVTLAKANSQAASHVPENWTHSSQLGGTPGERNFGSTIPATLEITDPWQFYQSGALEDAWKDPAFDDSQWETGTGLFFVERSALPAEKSTPLTIGQTTYYFRTKFNVDGNPDGAKLTLRHVIDDGAVFYLNGQEVARHNMPDGPIDFDTVSSRSVSNGSFAISQLDGAALQNGENTLAVEVHQSSPSSNDIAFGTELYVELVADETSSGLNNVRFNEIASANDEAFWIELANSGENAAALTGAKIKSSSGQEFTFTDEQIDAGGYLLLDGANLGLTPQSEEKLFLFDPSSEFTDAAIVSDQTIGLANDRHGRWQSVAAATPGEPNQFVFEDDIVINEIMFHHRPTYGEASISDFETLFDFDHEWRFDQSGLDIGTEWRNVDYDDSAWDSGQGLFFKETSALPGPKNTPLETGQITYRFRSTFELTDNILAEELTVRHIVDDGAVFYLNGVEIFRFNMPGGEIGVDTESDRSISNADSIGPVTLPKELLVAGTNTFAVEVHQSSPGSNDVVFGMQLARKFEVKAGVDYAENEQEWIELYNRSENAVDLSNWSLSDAVDFTFPNNTMLGPKEYAVIAKDSEAFLAEFPNLMPIGEYSGTLSNDNERIQLLDSIGNIADEVHYFDGGRWPDYSDAGGSSLELRDPFADNSRPEAWRASDELARSEWKNYSYTTTVLPVVHDPPINFHEFVMGMLSQSEILIDNISVIESPGGDGEELIQNGNFEQDTIGGDADKWRIVGTHNQSRVISDPDQPNNKVLHLIAENRMNYLSNHAETTLANGARVRDGNTYQISFDAKWVAGSPQLHTELYYKDAARTTILAQPDQSGTPGEQNSTFVENLGPTHANLIHSPVVPSSSDEVTIRVEAADPDGIDAVTLFYAVEGEAPFSTVAMTLENSGHYVGTIPAQDNRDVVQFYVQSTDVKGATSMYPPQGPESRALFKVDNSFGADPIRHDFQILMIDRDVDDLHRAIHMMDNNRIGSTVIYDGNEVFYDTGTRLRGSMFTRQNRGGTGYNVEFNNDQLFRGVHRSIGFDQNGEAEIVVKFSAAVSGNLGGTYDDVFQLETPSGQGGGPTLVYLARHAEVFLGEQFENGEDGTLFKFEGIRVMQTVSERNNPESLKLYQPIGWVPTFDIQDLGDDKELYRWPFLINRNRDIDNYQPIIDLAKTFSLTGDALEERTAEVMDMDNWTHTFALMSLFGIGDAYSQGNPHNLNIYQRPSDGKIVAFPWDWDFVFSQAPTAPLHGGKNIGKIFNIPTYEHMLMGHMNHMFQTNFNRDYMSRWTSHFGDMLGMNLSSHLNSIGNRTNHIKGLFPSLTQFHIGEEDLKVNETLFVSDESDAAVFIPSEENGGDQLGLDWIAPSFQIDDNWKQGKAAVGFEGTPGAFEDLIKLPIPEIRGENPSAYIRVPFNVENLQDFDLLTLRMKYDDGFTAFLNGEEIASANAPSRLEWDSRATASHRNPSAAQFSDFDITSFQHLLKEGENVLAIQGMNRSATGGDMLIVPELVGGIIEASETPAMVVDTPTVDLTGTGWIDVKEIRIAGNNDPLPLRWSTNTRWHTQIAVQPGLNELVLEAFDFGGELIASSPINITSTAARPELEYLRISELMYNPSDPTADEISMGFTDDNQFEFVELINTSDDQSIDLTGVSFIDGIEFTFSDVTIAQGERIVVAKDSAAFASRYGSDIATAGDFASGSLSNAGERIELVDSAGSTILEFEYRDGGRWPVRADGVGASLEMRNVSTTAADQYSKPYNWQASTEFGGSPGRAGAAPAGIVINELIAQTDPPIELHDSIELHNVTDSPIDIGGWFLSDSDNNLMKFQFAQGVSIAAGGYLVVDERDFNPTPNEPAPNHFALNGANGDSVWLTKPIGNSELEFVDDVHFRGSSNGESLGRVPNGSGTLVPLQSLSLGRENGEPRIGPVVISEINFHPESPTSAALEIWPELSPSDLEFVEIHNPTGEAIDLSEWRLRGEVDFDFPTQSLEANARTAILSFNPTSPANALRLNAFKVHYGLSDDVNFVGGYAGQLNNRHAEVRLERATTTFEQQRSFVLEDFAVYDNVNPWPTDTLGAGMSLHRIAPALMGNLAASWNSQSPSPGTGVTVSADFDSNGVTDQRDIDALCRNHGGNDLRFDLNGDGSINERDLNFMIEQVLGTTLGDANLDGVFNSSDLVRVFEFGQFEDGIEDNSGWEQGDWNCDGDFTSRDLVAVFIVGGFQE